MAPDVRRPIDRVLLFLAVTLMAVGLVWVYSASANKGAATNAAANAFLLRQLVGCGIGLALMLALSQAELTALREQPRILAVAYGVVVVMLVAVFFFPKVNNAHRWIRVGPMSLQPSELLKPLTVLIVAWWMVRHRDAMGRRQDALPKLITLGGILLVPLALVLKEPDFGTTFLIVLVTMFLIFLGGAPRWIFAVAIPLLGAIGFAFVWFVPFRRARVLSFLNPEADPLGTGHQALQSLIAMGNGGLQGVGLGGSMQKLHYLPEAHTDFIFAVIGEEAGFIGTFLVFSLFVLILLRGYRIARQVRDGYLKLCAMGFTLLLTAQAMMNMSVVLSLVPNKGIPLPFISYGSSSMIVSLACLGMLLSISKETAETP